MGVFLKMPKQVQADGKHSNWQPTYGTPKDVEGVNANRCRSSWSLSYRILVYGFSRFTQPKKTNMKHTKQFLKV